ncbi:hypothetical protein [Nannocystis pusilla]|uniref:PDZ domain-containing protein n=1 Tax=Nannocystis pusilla TaxID=889268 RepID=A0ABS7TKX1_9BACT|nr:hypothetical protein [Nannocystis pusilla]MBZ5708870.1 hypothetical protein [Nannocystis pusilla]
MTRRRTGAWSFVGLMLLGCDPAGRERAALQAELEAMSALLAEHRAQIEALQADLVQQQLALQECRRPSAPNLPALPASGPDAPALTPTCDAGVCVVKRAEFEALMEAPAVLARLARVIPSTREGKVVGYKLYSVRPGTPLELAGFKNGDLIQTIDGEALGGADEVLGLFVKLRRLDRWTIAGLRKDAPFELTIAVE